MHSAKKNKPINQHYLCIYILDVSNIRNDVIQQFMINESFEISITDNNKKKVTTEEKREIEKEDRKRREKRKKTTSTNLYQLKLK